jgi:hypothetical protein
VPGTGLRAHRDGLYGAAAWRSTAGAGGYTTTVQPWNRCQASIWPPAAGLCTLCCERWQLPCKPRRRDAPHPRVVLLLVPTFRFATFFRLFLSFFA